MKARADLRWSPPAIPARLAGWETALTETLTAELARPFDWAGANCLQLVACVCVAMTGVDPMRGLPPINGFAGAVSLMRSLRLWSVYGALKATFPPISSAMARRGDCGIEDRTATTVYVVMGNGMAVARGQTGPSYVRVEQLGICFSVGAR